MSKTGFWQRAFGVNEPSQPNARQALTRTDPTTCWRGLGSIIQWSQDVTGCEVEIREYLIEKQTKDKEIVIPPK